MRNVKVIGTSLLIIVVIFIGVGYMLPAEVIVSRKKLIDAPQDVVFSEVNTLKNWEDWSPWHQLDTSIHLIYSGPEQGAGATYAWSSDQKNVGSGRLKINKAVPNELINADLDFKKEYHSELTYYFEPAGEGTKCTWAMTSDMGYNIFGRWMGLFMGPMVGRDFEKGLVNLERSAKRRSAALPQQTFPEIIQISSRKVVTIRKDCQSSKIAETLDQCYDELLRHLQKVEINPADAPFSIYHSYSETNTSLEAGLVVNELPISTILIDAKELPATRAVTLSHLGPYEGTVSTHAAIDEYIQENDLKTSGSPWEVYVTDPTTEPDPSKWLTKVYYPLAD